MSPTTFFSSALAGAVLAAPALAFANAIPPQSATPTQISRPQPVRVDLPGRLVLDPKGLTIGGVTTPWGGSMTISYADTSTSQKYRYFPGKNGAPAVCIFDWSVPLDNVGATATTDIYQTDLWFDDGSAPNPVNTNPGVAPGAVVTAANWLGLQPGHYTMIAVLKGFPNWQSQNIVMTKQQISVTVAGSCTPPFSFEPSPIKVDPGIILPYATPTP